MRFSSLGLVFIRGEALGAIYRISSTAALTPSNPDIQTALVLSFIQIFCHLASYRPQFSEPGHCKRDSDSLF